MKSRIVWIGALALVAGVLAGVVSSQVAAEENDVLVVPIMVSPNTIVQDSMGVWVTVHAEIGYGAVMHGTVALNGIPARLLKADSRGELVAKFDIAEVKEIVAAPQTTLTLTGLTKSGIAFTGSDTVRVVK